MAAQRRCLAFAIRVDTSWAKNYSGGSSLGQILRYAYRFTIVQRRKFVRSDVSIVAAVAAVASFVLYLMRMVLKVSCLADFAVTIFFYSSMKAVRDGAILEGGLCLRSFALCITQSHCWNCQPKLSRCIYYSPVVPRFLHLRRFRCPAITYFKLSSDRCPCG